MKKGVIAVSTTIGLILLVVSLLALLNFVISGYDRVDSSYSNVLCKASVIANSKLNTPLFGEGAWPIQCPTVYYFFGYEGFFIESGDVKQEFSYDTNTRTLKPENKEFVKCMKDDAIKDGEFLEKTDVCKIRNMNFLMAQAHAQCWEQFGRGQLSMFDRLDTERQCVVCAVYDFSDEVQKKFGSYYVEDVVEEEHSFDYMMRTNGPLGRDITYAELANDPLDPYEPPYYTYSFDESYASLFIANNEDYFGQIVGQIEEVIGSLVKINVGEESRYFLNTNEFIPEAGVVRECDLLVEQ